MIQLICQICKINYSRLPCKAINSKYCSAECKGRARSGVRVVPLVMVICNNCRLSFLGQKNCNRQLHYCSQSCRNVDKTPRAERVSLLCVRCKVLYQRKPSLKFTSKFCSLDCRKQWRRRLSPTGKGRIATESAKFYSSKEWVWLRYQALVRDKFTCTLCGTQKEALHVNHIVPRGKNLELVLVLANLETLCVVCHGIKTLKEWPNMIGFYPKAASLLGLT